jgi:membrane-bound lytic murein transglycosylase D
MGMGRDLFRRETIVFPLSIVLLFVLSSTCQGQAAVPEVGALPARSAHRQGRPAAEAAWWEPAAAAWRDPAAEAAWQGPAAAAWREPVGSDGPVPALHDRRAAPAAELPPPDHPAVRLWQRRILDGGLPSLQEALNRGWAFRRFISARLAERGLPQELIYLPLLESYYRVRAVSRSGAAGLWQIMSNTAGPLGLRTDRWVDERRDFWKSTEAALEKLEDNYSLFGSWDLALAAYNCGTGRLSRTIRQSGIRDFWVLRERGLLPPETAEYVPKFYALLSIASEPAAHGLEVSWREAPTWSLVVLKRSVELALLAEKAGLPLDLMEDAHAELQTPITPPASGRSFQLKVPADQAARVERLLQDPQADLLRFTLHRVRTGDTFYGLAGYYGLSVSLLMEANPAVQADRMRIGQQLRIPLFSGRLPKAEPACGFSEAEASAFSSQYTVKAGDTLWGISSRFGTTSEALAWVNARSLDAPLKPGETLKVPPEADACAEEGDPL